MTVRKEIIIFDGIMDLSNTSEWVYNTYDEKAPSFKDLTPSINQNGGAEYSYNFWLYMDQDVMSNAMKGSTTDDIILLLRGSKKKIPYTNEKNCLVSGNQSYIFVKNPLIRIKSNGDAIVIEYNTVTSPDAYRENGKSIINCSSGSWMDRNKGHLGIYDMKHNITRTYHKKWFMFTLVLREITPENDILYKNKTSCKIYINGINVLDRIVESPYDGTYGSAAMKHNRGNLYVNPGNILSTTTANQNENPFAPKNNTDTSASVKMANLTYYNYALTEAEINQLTQKGFTKSPAARPVDPVDTYVEDPYTKSVITENRSNLPKPF